MARGHVHVPDKQRMRSIPVGKIHFYERDPNEHLYFKGGVPVPDTTPTCIIFPYDRVNKKFITSDYTSAQTKERESSQDIERLLDEINMPLATWTEQYGSAYEGRGIYLCLLITFLILLPLLPFYACYHTSKQTQARKALEEVKERIRGIIQEKGYSFAQKDLEWRVPTHFPIWMELWTGQDAKPQANIEMASYQQSGYLQQRNQVAPDGNHQQFMYNADMYGQA